MKNPKNNKTIETTETLNDLDSERNIRFIKNLGKEYFIYQHDINGVFQYLSNSITMMLGYSPEEFMHHYTTYLTDNPLNMDVIKFTDLSIKGIKQPPYLVEIFHKNSEKKWLEVTENPLINDKGVVFAVEGIARDVTVKIIAEKKLNALLEEKETLIAELYHRTNNNMQVIISMLSLQCNNHKDDGLKEPFRKIQNKIRAMALVHQKLYHRQSLSKIDLKEYSRDLFDLLMHQHCIKKDRIRFTFLGANFDILIDSALSLGLILNELFSNSFYHAFPDQRTGKISINLTKISRYEISLTFSDDGIGVPDPTIFDNPSTLGIKIINYMAIQLSGKAAFRNEGGVSCNLIFRDNLYNQRS